METRDCRERSILAVSCSVMPGLVPGIHALLSELNDVDGRDKPGHDGNTDDRASASRADRQVLYKI